MRNDINEEYEKLKIGQLYSSPITCLFLFSTEDLAMELAQTTSFVHTGGIATYTAKWLSQELYETVLIIPDGAPFLILQKGISFQVQALFGDKIGWFTFCEWMDLTNET